MSEPTNAAVFTPDAASAGQQVPAVQGDASSQEPKTAQPQYITLDEAQRLFKDAEDNAFRRAQGLVDKADNRITRKVQENLSGVQGMLDALKAQGVDVPADKAQALKNDAINKAYTDVAPELTPASPPKPAQALAQEGGDVDPVTAIAWQMMKAVGVTIDQDDPLLDRSSPVAFLNSVEAAIRATGVQPASVEGRRTPTSAGMRGAHVVPNYGDMSMDDLWAEGNK
uniref:Uncharacterized protein n=1 Tax=viral metagenome TaxID=1070528 RepID=A0A6M3KU18_9ZZZZ